MRKTTLVALTIIKYLMNQVPMIYECGENMSILIITVEGIDQIIIDKNYSYIVIIDSHIIYNIHFIKLIFLMIFDICNRK